VEGLNPKNATAFLGLNKPPPLKRGIEGVLKNLPNPPLQRRELLLFVKEGNFVDKGGFFL